MRGKKCLNTLSDYCKLTDMHWKGQATWQKYEFVFSIKGQMHSDFIPWAPVYLKIKSVANNPKPGVLFKISLNVTFLMYQSLPWQDHVSHNISSQWEDQNLKGN